MSMLAHWYQIRSVDAAPGMLTAPKPLTLRCGGRVAATTDTSMRSRCRRQSACSKAAWNAQSLRAMLASVSSWLMAASGPKTTEKSSSELNRVESKLENSTWKHLSVATRV